MLLWERCTTRNHGWKFSVLLDWNYMHFHNCIRLMILINGYRKDEIHSFMYHH